MVTFTACRSEPELVVPARATPREVRALSDVDNHPMLRYNLTAVGFFRCLVPGGAPEQPASFLKAGLAEALVHYYPMAGRLRELPGGKKLEVDCTAEGVVFVEAHADVRLVDFGMPLVPPYPCVDELICDVGDAGVIGKPLLYLQMTQLRCGGLVLGLSMCHSVVDGSGFVQISRCIFELARGEAQPAVLPVWERHLLVSSSSSPKAASISIMDSKSVTPAPPFDGEAMVRSFLFGPREMAALRSRVPPRLAQSSTVFELITAAVWRCRTAALEHAAHQRVRVVFALNARGSWKRDPPLPPGYYGNAGFTVMAEATAGELCGGPLARVVELVHRAKLRVATDGHVRLVLDLMARGDYHVDLPLDRTFFVSDVTRLGGGSVKLGSWEHVGGGVPSTGNILTRLPSLYTSCKDANGDDCVMVPMCLPELAMGRFASEIATMISVPAAARSSM